MKRAAMFLTSIGLVAGVAAQPELDFVFITAGGGSATGGTYEAQITISEEPVGIASGGDYELELGFVRLVASLDSGGPTRLCADQNQDGFVNPSDFAAWVANYNATNLLADTNQDGFVTPGDFGAWVAAFNLGLAGPTCTP